MKIAYIILAVVGIFIAGGILYRLVNAAKKSQSGNENKS
jgi:glucokinase